MRHAKERKRKLYHISIITIHRHRVEWKEESEWNEFTVVRMRNIKAKHTPTTIVGSIANSYIDNRIVPKIQKKERKMVQSFVYAYICMYVLWRNANPIAG